MAKIKVGKSSPEELHERASHLGMVEAHAQHTQALNRKMYDMKNKGVKKGNPRLSEFRMQIQAHLDASREHFAAANRGGPTVTNSFEAKDHAITPQSKRRFN